jgi:hypothetical protein
MSRGQQSATFNQTQGESKSSFGDTENSLKFEQGDIGTFADQLAAYQASNPYSAGGEYESNINEGLTNTSDAMAQSVGATLQGASARTGQNPAGAVAATEAMEEQNARNLGADKATAENQRISQEAAYDKSALPFEAEIPGMQSEIGKEQEGLYGTSLGTQEQAAKTPSFMETLEGQLAQAGESFAGGLGQGFGKQLAGGGGNG